MLSFPIDLAFDGVCDVRWYYWVVRIVIMKLRESSVNENKKYETMNSSISAQTVYIALQTLVKKKLWVQRHLCITCLEALKTLIVKVEKVKEV